jgi:hypothetical protein
MALDIREGDYLTVGAKDYPIKQCEEWAWDYGSGMRRFCRVEATTKRRERLAGGKAGEWETIETDLLVTPLDPAGGSSVSSRIALREALNTPHELLETSVNGGDVFYHLILENLKR